MIARDIVTSECDNDCATGVSITEARSLVITGGPMPLKEGSKAPVFTLKNEKGIDVNLKDFLGKIVILYFYPKDMTPGCTEEACDFRDMYDMFKKAKIVVLGVSKDSTASHLKFKSKHMLPFQLLSDPGAKVCEKYGVWKEKSMYGKKYMGIERTTVLINPEGYVLKVYNKVKVKGHTDQIIKDLSTH